MSSTYTSTPNTARDKDERKWPINNELSQWTWHHTYSHTHTHTHTHTHIYTHTQPPDLLEGCGTNIWRNERRQWISRPSANYQIHGYSFIRMNSFWNKMCVSLRKSHPLSWRWDYCGRYMPTAIIYSHSYSTLSLCQHTWLHFLMLTWSNSKKK